MPDAPSEALAGGRWSILLRHAERPPIPAGEFGTELSITPAGRAAAEQLGRRIGKRLLGLVTSPIPRCVQTGEAIRHGAGVALQIEQDRRLGAPGVWVQDEKTAGPVFLEHGVRGVVARQIAGQPLPGMRSHADGVDRLLELLGSRRDLPEGIVVYVTHDAVMAPLLAHVFDLPNVEDAMPRYLEAAAFELEASPVRRVWRGWRCEERDGSAPRAPHVRGRHRPR